MYIFSKQGFLMLITLFILAGCDNAPSHTFSESVHPLDLSGYPAEPPEQPITLLFIHHSVGAALLAEPGEKSGEYCLYDTHPNGGGLRNLLKQNNYSVHQATYGSELGEFTDINHWHAKFRDNMERALKTKIQDELLDEGEVNQVIMFKSCFPNNHFTQEGKPPGDPESAERTIWNAKAAYNSLLPIFEKYPDTLFIAFTAPPLVKPWMNRYKEMLLNLIGKGPEEAGLRARRFNNWLVDTEAGWLSGYNLHNVVVFDFYDILTKNGASNWAEFGSRDGKNSHPNSKGNIIAAKEFIPFLNRSVGYSSIAGAEQDNAATMAAE